MSKVRIYAEDLTDVLLEADYPEMSLVKDGIFERKFSGELLSWKGLMTEIYFDDIHIGYENMHIPQHTSLHFQSDNESVQMWFLLSGDMSIQGKSPSEQLTFHQNQHNISYSNTILYKTEWLASKQMLSFGVNLSPSFARRYFPADIPIFEKFLSKIEKQEPASLSPYNLIISPQMYFIIQEIMSCDRTGKFKRMFLEAKVIELLTLQLEEISKNTGKPYSLKKNDLDKIYAVKEILQHNMNSHYTLKDLAKTVGTNEFTLKKGFKEVFGATIFNYWNRIKMQEAKQVLLDGNKTVQKVSEMIGYKNPQHFSTAFKREYGIAPSLIKR